MQMDEHFRTAPFERNLPVLMGLLGVWYNDFFGAQTVAVLPYEQYLKRFPAYLQQLTMESNGKHVTLDGNHVNYAHRTDLLGRAGNQRPALLLSADPPGNASSFPAISSPSPRPLNPLGRHHDILMANVFAQAEALAFGKTAEQVKAEGTPDWLVPHRVFEGNRPSNTILADRLTPETLGKLVALYEHSVFTQGTIWRHRFVRPVGRGTGQSSGAAHRAGTGKPERARVETRQLDEQPDPPLPRNAVPLEWRKHSCVPCSQSCEHKVALQPVGLNKCPKAPVPPRGAAHSKHRQSPPPKSPPEPIQRSRSDTKRP